MPGGELSAETRRRRLTMTFTGFEEVRAALRGNGPLAQAVLTAGKQAMIRCAEDLLGRAMRGAPVDEGTLRASGTAAVFVDRQQVSRHGSVAIRQDTGQAIARARLGDYQAQPSAQVGHEVRAREALQPNALGSQIIGRVGFNVPYAYKQHEHTEYRHPKGGQALYLRQPLEQQGNAYYRHLGDAVRRALL